MESERDTAAMALKTAATQPFAPVAAAHRRGVRRMNWDKRERMSEREMEPRVGP